MTKQEQREMILKKLYWMKKDQDKKAGLPDIERFACIVTLKKAIRKAMGIEVDHYEVVSLPSYFNSGSYRTAAEYFSDHDNAVVDEIIRRMEAQGFIRIHDRKYYQDVEVLKTR